MARLRPEEHQRYTRLIRGAMGSTFAFAPEREGDQTIQVERGVVFPMAVTGQTRSAIEPVLSPVVSSASTASVVDRSGHVRLAYPGLLVYCCAQALRQTSADPAAMDPAPGLRQWGVRL